MSHLEISLFGPIQVHLDGQPITHFRAETAQALLAYLATHAGTPCRRTSLAGLLWSDYDESSALTNLRQALRRLRTAIKDRESTPPFLQVTRTTIAFSQESDCWLDVAAFADALDAVRNHTHRRPETCAPCAKRLTEAIELCRGEFLAGFSLPSALFEEWMVLERQRLHGQALEALGHLAAYHEAQEEYEQALHHARRQLELEPWREEAHRTLMRALALRGQRSAALVQYEACCRTLLEELGVEPAAETRALYERIRDGEDLSGFLKPDRSAHSNLPAQLTPFIGRESELAEIEERLGDPACRLLTLVGPGGSGKTRLALEAVRQQLDAYEDGAFSVSLAPLGSVEAIVPTVAQAIGLSFHTGEGPKQQLLHYLRRKQMLLLLDNYEHLLDGAGLTTDLLRMAPALQIVVTSRAALNVGGEHLLPVSGMDCPEQTAAAPAEAAQYGALQLFASAAQRIDRDFRLSPKNVPHVVQICRLVSGMPLAILLAAAWIKALTPAEIAAEIGRSYDFLSLGLRDAPERQRSMRAVFDHSWHLLAEWERAVMRALSVFRGGWTQEAAREVAGASARDLMSLVNSSMLQRVPPGRYEVHELLRQYAEGKLAATDGGGTGAHDRHCTYYAAALQAWERDLKSARQQAALAEMDVEIENARAAWAWAVERGQIEELDRAAECLSLFYQRRARDQEAEAAFQMAAEGLKARYGLVAMDQRANAAPAEGLRTLARMLAWQGISAWRSVRTELAYAPLQQSLDLLAQPELVGCDTRQEKALVLWALGWIGFDTGWQDTRQRLEDSLALFQALGNRWWVMRVLELLGLLAWDSGDYGSSERWNDVRLTMCRALDDAREIAWAMLCQSFGHSWQGRAEQAEPLAREALARYQELDDQWGIAFGLGVLGLSKKMAGQHAESVSLAERGLAIFDSLSVHVKDHGYLTDVARANLHVGQYERARALAEQALALTQERDQRRETGRPLAVLGPIALAEGAASEARQWLEQGIAVYQAFGMQDKLALAHAVMGYVTRALGQVAQAQQHLCQALRIGTKLASFLSIAFALPATALLMADQGEAERAVEIYALASRYPYVSNSRWFEDVAGREMAAAAEGLPSGIAMAAQERGRARDLWETAEELLVELGAQAAD